MIESENRSSVFKKVRYIIYFFVLGGVASYYFSYFFVPPQERRLETLVGKSFSENPSKIMFKDITDFNWQFVCLIGSYDSKKERILDFQNLSEEKKKKLEDGLGVNMDYASFMRELPRMKPFLYFAGVYYEMAFVFFENNKRVKAWRISRDWLVMNEENYIWTSESEKTCIVFNDATLEVQKKLSGERFLVFKNMQGETL